MNTSTITLYASGLFANWGFGDGDMLSEHPLFLDADAPGQNRCHRQALVSLVERFLLPKLPASLRTERYSTHNPVRVVDEERHRKAEFEHICVEISHEQIEDVLLEQMPSRKLAGMRAGTPRLRAVPGSPGSRKRATRPSAKQLQLPIAHELIIDNFAGGGGTSEGLEQAFGRPVDIAINHDPEALAMHAINHPHTLHLCESVWDVNPRQVTKGQPVALVWLSPDCKHFSKAKGGTPVSKNIRGLAWVGMRWVATTKPRVLMLENVEEFVTWGPLKSGLDKEGNVVWLPDPAKKGVTFNSFVRQLRGHGYEVEWRELRACDNGAPTIRKRLFLIARRDGLPIVWPEQTHAEPTHEEVIAGRMAPHRTAADCIDFTLDAASIFGRKRDLVNNTLRRVAKGLWRQVLTKAEPFLVNTRNGERVGQDPRIRSIDEPYWTVTSQGSQGALSQPLLAPFMAGAGGPEYAGKPVSANRPFGTLTTENHRAVVSPELMPMSAPFLTEHANSSNQRTMPADEPLRTICAQVKGGHFSLVDPLLAPLIVTNTTGHPGAGIEQPLPTVTTGGHHILVAPVITPLRGTEESHLAGDSIEAPLSTISAGGTHHALASACMEALDAGLQQAHFIAGLAHGAHANRDAGDRSHPLSEPLRTIHAGGGNQAIVAAHLVDMGHGESSATGAKRWSHGVRSLEVPLNTVTASGATSALAAVHLTHLTHHGERSGYGADEPFKTVTGANRGEQAIVAACLEQAYGGFAVDNDGRSVDAPVSTIMSKGANQRLISAFLEQANGGFYRGEGRPADEPMSTVCASGSKKMLVSAYLIHQQATLDAIKPSKSGKGRRTKVTKVVHKDVQATQSIWVPEDFLSPEQIANARLCAQLLHEHLPEQFPEPAELILVWQKGCWWVVADITLRMLKPRELFNAQGFPRSYIIHEIPDPAFLFVDGVQVANPLEVPRIPLTTTAQVRMCGNSVSPYQSYALAKGNFRHEDMYRMQVAA
jgi:DNA (cytosine-5)-methyltransferase 1